MASLVSMPHPGAGRGMKGKGGRENIGVLVIPWAQRETIRSPTEDTQASWMRAESTFSCLLTFIHASLDAQMCMLLLALCGFSAINYLICLPLLMDRYRHFSRWEWWCSARSNIASCVMLSRIWQLFALTLHYVPIIAPLLLLLFQTA